MYVRIPQLTLLTAFSDQWAIIHLPEDQFKLPIHRWLWNCHRVHMLRKSSNYRSHPIESLDVQVVIGKSKRNAKLMKTLQSQA